MAKLYYILLDQSMTVKVGKTWVFKKSNPVGLIKFLGFIGFNWAELIFRGFIRKCFNIV